MPYKDPAVRKQKASEYSKKYYLENKEYYKQKNREQRKASRKRWHEFKKTLFCVQCHENHPATLDFHHAQTDVTNVKLYKLAGSNSLKKAKEEIKKCIVLCSNCHRKHHYNEKITKKNKKELA